MPHRSFVFGIVFCWPSKLLAEGYGSQSDLFGAHPRGVPWLMGWEGPRQEIFVGLISLDLVMVCSFGAENSYMLQNM